MRRFNNWWLVGVVSLGCGDDVAGSASGSSGGAESSGSASSSGESGGQVPTTAGPGSLSEGMSTGTGEAATLTGSEGTGSSGGVSTGESSGTSAGESTGTSAGESTGESTGDASTGEGVCGDPVESMGGAIAFGGLGGEQALGFGVGVDGSRYSGGVFFGPSVDLKPGGGAVFPAQGDSGNMWLNKVDADGGYVYGYTWPTLDGFHCYVWEFAPDVDGSVYVVGHFVGDLDFDPGPGVDKHKAGNGAGQLWGFLMKFGPDGAYQWGRHWGTSFSTAFGLAMAADGSLYVTGYFDGEIDLDPGPGVDMFTASGVGNATNGYLSKFDHDGNYLWGRTWGVGGEVYSFDVALDGAGNPSVTGTAGGPADLDPGPGMQVHVGVGLADTFVESFTADGEWRWGFAIGGDNYEQINDVAVDPQGRVWVVGGVSSTSIDLDPGPGVVLQVNKGQYDGFVARYGVDGAYDASWALSGDGHENLWGISIDCQGSVFVAGHFGGAVDLDPGAGVKMHVSGGETDPFVLALDADGAYRWSRSWPNVEYGVTQSVKLDGDGMVHAQINFYGEIDADAGNGVVPFVSEGDEDVLLQRLRPGSGDW